MNRFIIGNLYYFYYDPKGRDDLDYYDRFPLVLTLEKYTDGFLLDIFYNSIIDKQIDHWLIEIFNKYNYSIYSSQPLLCYSPLVGDSDIR